MTKPTPVSTIGERPLIARLSKIFNSVRSPEIILGASADDYAVTNMTGTKLEHQTYLSPVKAIISINRWWFQKYDTFLPVVKLRLYHLFQPQ